jgi:hypothetical protein
MELYKFIHSREDRKQMIEHGATAAATDAATDASDQSKN